LSQPAPVVFDDALFEADLQRASELGAEAAGAARKRFENGGVPRDELRLCQAEGTEGSQLPSCLKVYLPPSAGRFGMVFQLEIVDDRAQLRYIAFGVRHHPPESNAETVYQVADKRLRE
jgi:hypothetical protein